MSQRRDHFRLKFPITQRPRLLVAGVELDVVELSESGARIALPPNAGPMSGEAFAAAIHFKDGTAATTTARVDRRERDQLVLRFADNLPYSLIAGQQRRLLQLFPREGRQ